MTDRRQTPFLLLSVMLGMICAPVHADDQEATVSRAANSPRAAILPEGLDAQQYPHLHNLRQITTSFFSGGEPETEAAFEELQRLGITTIVSVDGATPNIELASKYRLRYVHVPIGYDGISEAAGKSFARVVRDVKGPVYVHCHHGRHRGPAAVAVMAIASGAATSDQAVKILEVCGTSRDYAGLWRDVAAYRTPGEKAKLPQLSPIAQVDGFVTSMVRLERAMQQLIELQKNEWKPIANQPEIQAEPAAAIVYEDFRETIRLHLADREPEFKQLMQNAFKQSQGLQTALKAKDYGTASTALQSLGQQCVNCHKDFRN
ncbi:MAG: cytochrome c [Planctomycetaceae bacterium]|nr:cytochrome c [Planctomycetaceae bacterium]